MALAAALRDRLLEPCGIDVGVDGGGANVGVAGEFADDRGVGAGVGEVGAESVAQDVRAATVLRKPALAAWQATILEMSRVLRARGGWPVRGSESSSARSPRRGGS